MSAYERAITLARRQGLVPNEAIASELTARFYAARDFETIARAYWQQARSGYLRWGAMGKVRQLDILHAGVRDELEHSRPGAAIDAPAAQLDLATVVKTSQAVTGEVGLENLVETLMIIALEHAGADRGLLILPHAGEFHVEAEASARGGAGVSVELRREVARHPDVPETVLHYVSRTHELVLLDDAQSAHAFTSDPYLRELSPRSVRLYSAGQAGGAGWIAVPRKPSVFARVYERAHCGVDAAGFASGNLVGERLARREKRHAG